MDWRFKSVRGLYDREGTNLVRFVLFLFFLFFNDAEKPDIMKTREFLKFETEFLRKERTDITRNFLIVEALYREAVALGVIPTRNPLEGLEVDLRIAKVINSVPKTP